MISFSPSQIIKAYQNCLKVLHLDSLPSTDPEIYFLQYYGLFVEKSIIHESNSKEIYLKNFYNLFQLCNAAFYFDGRAPYAAYLAIFLSCLSPLIPLKYLKICKVSKLADLSGTTVRQRLKDIEVILYKLLKTKSLQPPTFEESLQVFFKYAVIFQFEDMLICPQSMERNNVNVRVHSAAIAQIDQMLANPSEENKIYLQSLFALDAILTNILYLALLGIPTKMLISLSESALRDLVELSQQAPESSTYLLDPL